MVSYDCIGTPITPEVAPCPGLTVTPKPAYGRGVTMDEIGADFAEHLPSCFRTVERQIEMVSKIAGLDPKDFVLNITWTLHRKH